MQQLPEWKYSQAAPGQYWYLVAKTGFHPLASGSGEKAPLVICPAAPARLFGLGHGRPQIT